MGKTKWHQNYAGSTYMYYMKNAKREKVVYYFQIRNNYFAYCMFLCSKSKYKKGTWISYIVRRVPGVQWLAISKYSCTRNTNISYKVSAVPGIQWLCLYRRYQSCGRKVVTLDAGTKSRSPKHWCTPYCMYIDARPIVNTLMHVLL